MTIKRNVEHTRKSFVAIRGDQCATILRILMDGWTIALHRGSIDRSMLEIPVTERLRDGMRSVADRHVPKQLAVRAGTETRSHPDTDIPDGRTDLSVFFRDLWDEYGEHDHHAIIECKRVAGESSDLCRRYVVNGIDRFKEGKYAARHAVGFMVGYLLSGDADAATAGINGYLSGRGRVADQLRPCTAIALDWTRSSRHTRPVPQEPIDLHHAFLGFEAAS